MVECARVLVQNAYDTQLSTEQGVSNCYDNLSGVSRGNGGGVHISSVVSDIFDEVEERSKNPTEVWGLSTGFVDWDTLLGGLQPAEMMYIAGQPGIGKSKLMLQTGFNVAKQGKRVAIWSLEMLAKALGYRLVSGAGKIPTRLLKSGQLPDQEWPRFIHTIEELSKLDLWIYTDPDTSLTSMSAELARLNAQKPVDLVCLDYLLLLRGYDQMNETERSGPLSEGVHRLAMKYAIPFVTVSSVTKDAIDAKGASQSHVRGSSVLIHNADVIAEIKKDKNAPGTVDLAFTKVRGEANANKRIRLVEYETYPFFADMKGANNVRSQFST